MAVFLKCVLNCSTLNIFVCLKQFNISQLLQNTYHYIIFLSLPTLQNT